MKKEKTYAVVDLETTGTKMDGTNRIIQFSCVFVKYSKIVNQFNTLVNPLSEIPAEVQSLTGITPKEVRNAPLFEDVAGTIYALLQDTIFVAHNIQFDYRFLNQELERVGYPELDLERVDTVQLSQILFPTLPSYRLQDLGKSLKIKHTHPHQADSDALVTAKLLIKMQQKLHYLPLSLLRQLSLMSSSLLFETNSLFKKVYRERQHKPYKNDQWVTIDKLTLLKHRSLIKKRATQVKIDLNNTKQLKQIWPHNFEKRPVQFKLMCDVQYSLKKRIHKVFFEAPTGTGKTLGYLLPCALESQEGKKFLISTTTNALQNQLIDKDIQNLENILPFRLNVISLKGNQHYIDLDKFARTLNQPQNNYTRLVQMSILVWLAETKTGDLDELQLLEQHLPLFDEIIHHGVKGLDNESPYYKYDFVRQRTQQVSAANFIITNHTYLMHHIDEFRSPRRVLVIDEAPQFTETVLHNNNDILDFDEVRILSNTLLVKMRSRVSCSFENLIAQGLLSRVKYHELVRNLQVIANCVSHIRDAFYDTFIKKYSSNESILQVPVSVSKMYAFIKNKLNLYNKIDHSINFLKNVSPHLYQQFIKALDDQCLDTRSFNLFKNYFKLYAQLLNALNGWKRLSLTNLELNEQEILLWLTYPQHQKTGHLRLHFGLLETHEYFKQLIYPHFAQIMLFSGNNFTPKTYQYLSDQLALANAVHYKYKSTFDYAKQAELLLPVDAPDIDHVSEEFYIDYLVKAILAIGDADQHQTMILFNSNEMLQQVYEELIKTPLTQKWTLLAQGINGTPEKLKKRFSPKSPHPQMLLATGTFWEGVDLPYEQLETLVITKLPFQAIQDTYNQIRYHKEEQNGGNAFTNIFLPEAIMRFNQGIGRLIRTQKDRGIAVVLDARIFKRNYGKAFLKTLPPKMSIHKIQTATLTHMINKFFSQNKN